MHRRTISLLICMMMLMTLTPVTSAIGSNSTEVPVLITSGPDGMTADPGKAVPTGYRLATEDDISLIKLQLFGDGESNTSLTMDLMTGDRMFPTGLLIPTNDELDGMVGRLLLPNEGGHVLTEAFPTSFDLSIEPYFPQIRSQGSEGSCAAWAIIYYNFGYLEAVDNGWDDAYQGNNEHLLSPAWSYNKVVYNGYGSSLQDNALVAQRTGICTWAEMPYVNGDHISWGGETAWRGAPLHKISDQVYHPFSDSSTIESIKEALLSKHPVSIAIDATPINGAQPAFSDGNKILSSAEYSSTTTNHGVTIVGYDDSVTDDGDVGAFKIANSWGASWGENGYFWMTYAAIKEVGNKLQMTTLIDIEDNRPTDLAVWHFDPAPTREAKVKLSAIRVLDGLVMSTVEPFFDCGSSDRMPDFMVQDISELSPYIQDQRYRIDLSIGDGALDGSVSSFRLERCAIPYVNGKASMASGQSPGVPFLTPGHASVQLLGTEVSAPEALSYDGAFSFLGNAQWVGMRDVKGREHVMRSGDVGNGNYSSLIVLLHGPGTFTFDWAVSSEINVDRLSVNMDGMLKESITGASDWATRSIEVPSGFHHISFIYAKDATASANDDCGYLDNIYWNGGRVAVFDDFENSDLTWTFADMNPSSGEDSWNGSTLFRWSGSRSLWCSEDGMGTNGRPNHLNGYYDKEMDAVAVLALPDLSLFKEARMSFVYWADTGTTSLSDLAYVRALDHEGWSIIWTQPSPVTTGWTVVDLPLPVDVTQLELCFHSDDVAEAGTHKGVFIDALLMTVWEEEVPSPPVSSIDPLPSFWNRTSLNMSYTASAYSGKEVDHVQVFFRKGTSGNYSLYAPISNPSGNWTSGIVQVELEGLGLGEGLYQFYSLAYDSGGLVETAPYAPDASTTFDLGAPVTTLSHNGKDPPAWNPPGVRVTLSAGDAVSGVSAIYYKIDNGPWTSYSLPFFLTSHGQHVVRYYSVDRAGNSDVVRSVVLNIDSLDPVSTSTLTGEVGEDGWYIGPVVVNITSTDQGSGVYRIIYRIDDGPWTTYRGSFILDIEGKDTLYYRAQDLVGNIESEKCVMLSVDSAPPITRASIEGPGLIEDKMFNGPVMIALASEDARSGVSFIESSLDGGPWLTYSGAFVVSEEGAHELRYRATDGAGNVEDIKALAFMIDMTSPMVGMVVNGTSVNEGWYVGDIVIEMNAADALSGIKGLTYRVDGGDWKDADGSNATIFVSGEGGHTVEYMVVDLVGNALSSSIGGLNIDTIAPSITFGAVDGAVSNTTSLDLDVSVSDAGSGVSSVRYILDGGEEVLMPDGTVHLNGLTEGGHELVVVAEDAAGNVASASLTFIVDLPDPPLEEDDGPDEMVPIVIAALAGFAAVIAVLLVFRRK